MKETTESYKIVEVDNKTGEKKFFSDSTCSPKNQDRAIVSLMKWADENRAALDPPCADYTTRIKETLVISCIPYILGKVFKDLSKGSSSTIGNVTLEIERGERTCELVILIELTCGEGECPGIVSVRKTLFVSRNSTVVSRGKEVLNEAKSLARSDAYFSFTGKGFEEYNTPAPLFLFDGAIIECREMMLLLGKLSKSFETRIKGNIKNPCAALEKRWTCKKGELAKNRSAVLSLEKHLAEISKRKDKILEVARKNEHSRATAKNVVDKVVDYIESCVYESGDLRITGAAYGVAVMSLNKDELKEYRRVRNLRPDVREVLLKRLRVSGFGTTDILYYLELGSHLFYCDNPAQSLSDPKDICRVLSDMAYVLEGSKENGNKDDSRGFKTPEDDSLSEEEKSESEQPESQTDNTENDEETESPIEDEITEKKGEKT